MIRQILTDENPLLREMSREVSLEELSTPEVQGVIDDMLQTLKTTTGVGLAAPQIGQLLRIVILDKPMTVIVNPEVSPAGTELQTTFEGCLSVPGKRGEVERPKTVHVKGFTRQGKPISITLTGFRAAVVQHEEDHLNGILYVDRAPVVVSDDTAYQPAVPVPPASTEPVRTNGKKRTYVVKSPEAVGGTQYFGWTFHETGRLVDMRVQPGAAMVTGVWLSGVRLKARGFKVGAATKMLLGEHGLHVQAGDQLRFEIRVVGRKKIVAEIDHDATG